MDPLLLALFLGQFILNSANSAISPFFPQRAVQYGISMSFIGLIFSVHPVGNFIVTLLLSKYLSKGENRKPATLIGVLLTGIGMLGFGFVFMIEEKWLFISATLFSRFLLGVGNALFSTPAFAYIPLLYKSSFEEKCAYMESSVALGLMIGPILGSILLELYGYVCPFIFFAIVCFGLVPTLQKLIPLQSDISERQQIQKINEKQGEKGEKVENEEEEEDEEEEFEVDYKKIFKNRSIVLNYIIIFLPCCGLLFLDPTMGIFYSETFGLDDLQIGLVFSVSTVVYMAFTPCGTRLMKITSNYEMLLLIGAILTAFAFFFLGPDELTGLPKSLYITLIADGVQGLATLFIYIPALPQLFKLLCKMYPDESQEIMGDIASALYNTSYAVGEFIGPLLGGILCEYVSFPRAASLFGLFILIFCGFYVKYGEVLHYKPDEKDSKIPPSPKHLPSGNLKARNSSLRGIYTAGNSITKKSRPMFYTPLVLGREKNSNFVVIRNRKKLKDGKNSKILNVNKEFNQAYQMEEFNIQQSNNSLIAPTNTKFQAFSANDLRYPLKQNEF